MSINLNNLNESNEFLNILFNNITSALFILDKNTQVQNMNDSFSVLFQKSDNQALGQPCGNALGCKFTVLENKPCGETSYCSQCTLRKDILSTMSEKIPTTKRKLSRDFYINKQKETKHFTYSTRYIQYHGKEYILIIFDDHTELENHKQKLEEQNETLKALNDQKSKFLGIAAHDLRTPIGAINSFSDLLIESETDFSDEDKYEFLCLIRDSSRFSLKLLNELLDISKIELGQLDLNKKMCDIKELVKNTIKINKIFARKKRINIEFIADSSECLASVDKSKIEQVLHNLLSNAIKYSNKETTVTISIVKNKSFLKIAIKDQGVGIPEKEMSKLFKEFGKTSAKTTANESSTGLGLAIAKKIVNGHGGEIMGNSKLGKGSEFLFTLPLS